jgi:hypothetical protein
MEIDHRLVTETQHLSKVVRVLLMFCTYEVSQDGERTCVRERRKVAG